MSLRRVKRGGRSRDSCVGLTTTIIVLAWCFKGTLETQCQKSSQYLEKFCPNKGSSQWKMSLPWFCASQSCSHSNQSHSRSWRRCRWRLKRPSNNRNWQ
ncbi:hypothetical protein JOB18_028345 [Solea senegalensis]|uniref:Secreted protein n=1 Tax=Solea senegalensis TaxID=28829 RepID=A0AAV6Q9L5_SOLSE|nr:hypothetical protein JOB18_028345 [Solea senegalensis]